MASEGSSRWATANRSRSSTVDRSCCPLDRGFVVSRARPEWGDPHGPRSSTLAVLRPARSRMSSATIARGSRRLARIASSQPAGDGFDRAYRADTSRRSYTTRTRPSFHSWRSPSARRARASSPSPPNPENSSCARSASPDRLASRSRSVTCSAQPAPRSPARASRPDRPARDDHRRRGEPRPWPPATWPGTRWRSRLGGHRRARRQVGDAVIRRWSPSVADDADRGARHGASRRGSGCQRASSSSLTAGNSRTVRIPLHPSSTGRYPGATLA